MSAWPQSGLELDLTDIVDRAGLPTPVRQHSLRLASGEVNHLDVAWPDIRLAACPRDPSAAGAVLLVVPPSTRMLGLTRLPPPLATPSGRQNHHHRYGQGP